MLYTTAGMRRAVIGLDAATGEMRWMHSDDEGARNERAASRCGPRRGLLGGGGRQRSAGDIYAYRLGTG